MSKTKLSLVLIFFSALALNAQTNEKLVGLFSVRLNGNRVADDILIGIELEARKDILNWNLGKAHVGLSTQYGISLISNDNTQITNTSTNYWQYIQAVVGHRFLFFNERLSIHTGVKFGPSNFRQKATLQDSNLGIDRSYQYSKTQLTMHSQLGIGYRFGNSWSLEVLGYLPVANTKLAPKGLGLGLNFNI